MHLKRINWIDFLAMMLKRYVLGLQYVAHTYTPLSILSPRWNLSECRFFGKAVRGSRLITSAGWGHCVTSGQVPSCLLFVFFFPSFLLFLSFQCALRWPGGGGPLDPACTGGDAGCRGGSIGWRTGGHPTDVVGVPAHH